MSSSSGPNGVANGLVFCMDAGTIKNQTIFSSNFYTNSAFGDGSGMPYESGSNPTNEVIAFPNPGDSAFVLRQTGTFAYTEYQINLTSQLVASTTYCLSGWYAESSDYSCADGSRMFHCRAFSTSGAHVALGIGIGTVLKTVVVNGITWRYCYDLITTPSDYSNAFEWYVGYGGSAYTGYRYYTNLKMERGTFPSMLDLSGRNNHGYGVNGITYNASNGGSLVFDGTNDYVDVGNPSSLSMGTGDFSLESFFNVSGDAGYRIILQKGNPGVGANRGYRLRIELNNTIVMTVTGDTELTATSSAITYNTWYHVVGTKTNSELQIYINGMLSGTGSAPAGTTTVSNNFTIGLQDAGNWPFNGKISTVRVYNKALTPQEIQRNYMSLRGRYGL